MWYEKPGEKPPFPAPGFRNVPGYHKLSQHTEHRESLPHPIHDADSCCPAYTHNLQAQSTHAHRLCYGYNYSSPQ